MSPMQPAISTRVFSHLVASSLSRHSEAERLAPFVFHLLPGALEVTQKLAAYLVDLPATSSDTTLFGRALCSAIVAVDRLGTVPWTTVNHLAGYPVFVGALLFDVSDIARLRVSFTTGRPWTPADGPFLPHLKRPGRSVSFSDTHPTSSELVSLRVQMLTHLIASTDLPRLSSTWRSILSPQDHAS